MSSKKNIIWLKGHYHQHRNCLDADSQWSIVPFFKSMQVLQQIETWSIPAGKIFGLATDGSH